MKKITKATFKSFIKKNEGKLEFMLRADFNGQTDCVEHVPHEERMFLPLRRREFQKWEFDYGLERGRTVEEIKENLLNNENTLGYVGIWLVGSSRDYFNHYEDTTHIGIEVYNCCGSFTVAIPKLKAAA